ncbi:MAG TPA: phage portal protein [Pirellulales bacterium]|jgi:capsid protein
MARELRRNNDTVKLADHMEDLRTDYAAAHESRYRRRREGVLAVGTHADWHYRIEIGHYMRVMEQVRDFDRNDLLAGQMIDTVVNNTYQDGFTLIPSTGDRGRNEALSDRWISWSDDPEQCDIEGERSFGEIVGANLRHMLVDGDIVDLFLEGGQLQCIEGHRIRTPRTTRNVVLGVLLSDQRKRLEYWISKEDLSPNSVAGRVGDMLRIPVRDEDGYRQLAHVYHPKRVTQTRGVSVFAPCFDALGMFEDIQFAALVRQQILSCFAILRERGQDWNGENPPLLGDIKSPAGAQAPPPQRGTMPRQKIAPGMEVLGEKGEKISAWNPTVPSMEFLQHMRAIVQLIGVNLGLPLILALMDASETNFSGWRGALDQAKLGFRKNQRALARRLLRPVYQWKVRQWMADDPGFRPRKSERDVLDFSGFGSDGANVLKHHWQMPAFPYIEPLKDSQTDLLQLSNALTSPRRKYAERNLRFSDIVRETISDRGAAIIRAKKTSAKINGLFPDDPDRTSWRDLLPLPTPAGVKIAAAEQIGDDQDDADASTAKKPPTKTATPAKRARSPRQFQGAGA